MRRRACRGEHPGAIRDHQLRHGQHRVEVQLWVGSACATKRWAWSRSAVVARSDVLAGGACRHRTWARRARAIATRSTARPRTEPRDAAVARETRKKLHRFHQQMCPASPWVLHLVGDPPVAREAKARQADGMTKHVPAKVFPSHVVVPTHGHPSMQTISVEVRAPGLASPREPRIQVHVVGVWEGRVSDGDRAAVVAGVRVAVRARRPSPPRHGHEA